MLKNDLNLNNSQKINIIINVVAGFFLLALFTITWFASTHYSMFVAFFFLYTILMTLLEVFSLFQFTSFSLYLFMYILPTISSFFIRFRFIEEALDLKNENVSLEKNKMLFYKTSNNLYKFSLLFLVITAIFICVQILNGQCYPIYQIGFALAFFASVYCIFKIVKTSPSKNVKKNKMLKYDPTSARLCFIVLLLAVFDMFVMVLKIISSTCSVYLRTNFALAYVIAFICLVSLYVFDKQKQHYAAQIETKNEENILNKVKANPVIVEQHPFHILAASALPFFTSLFTFDMLFFTVKYFHYGLNKYVTFHLTFSITGLIITLTIWFLSIIKESNEGHHTKKVRWNLLHGMMLFIVSEVMLFFSIFWAFFHSSLSPSVAIYCVWPPLGIETINPWYLPFLNTIVLLSSGVSLTYAHSCLVLGEYKLTSRGLIITLIYGVFFSIVQLFEYINAPFSINDGIYGSVFFLSTGFHGLHVIIGSIMLLVNLIRNGFRNLLPTQHVGFTSAAWYWHFVDVVWLFLFLSIYWWGS